MIWNDTTNAVPIGSFRLTVASPCSLGCIYTGTIRKGDCFGSFGFEFLTDSPLKERGHLALYASNVQYTTLRPSLD